MQQGSFKDLLTDMSRVKQDNRPVSEILLGCIEKSAPRLNVPAEEAPAEEAPAEEAPAEEMLTLNIKSMSDFIADKKNAQSLQLSNDAFYYLYYEEEPLDEANLEEAEEILALFPNGFYIEGDWKAVEETDLIEATFVPFTKVKQVDYDAYMAITNYVRLLIKWIDPGKKVKAWFLNSQTEESTQLGECLVYIDKYKHKCFHTGNQAEEFTPGKMSLFYLKDFKARS